MLQPGHDAPQEGDVAVNALRAKGGPARRQAKAVAERCAQQDASLFRRRPSKQQIVVRSGDVAAKEGGGRVLHVARNHVPSVGARVPSDASAVGGAAAAGCVRDAHVALQHRDRGANRVRDGVEHFLQPRRLPETLHFGEAGAQKRFDRVVCQAVQAVHPVEEQQHEASLQQHEQEERPRQAPQHATLVPQHGDDRDHTDTQRHGAAAHQCVQHAGAKEGRGDRFPQQLDVEVEELSCVRGEGVADKHRISFVQRGRGGECGGGQHASHPCHNKAVAPSRAWAARAEAATNRRENGKGGGDDQPREKPVLPVRACHRHHLLDRLLQRR
mmetsp:Transcript_33203/g.109431  ORF Transcript_33203/g.109431 Transcript_33203/m.109431 type:complete len:328 (+) Transcript_33203:607-1590(+)